MTPEELLAKTADRIEQGWCQRALNDGKGNVCLLGAMGIHQPGLETYYQAVLAIATEIGIIMQEIPDWNDAPGRSKEEVVATVRNAKRWLWNPRFQSGMS